MLTKARQWGGRHGQAAAYALSTLRQKPLSAWVTISVIAVALTIPTLFWIVRDNLNKLAATWHQQAQIALYLKTNSTPDERLQALALVRKVPGVAQATLKTPEQGFSELAQQQGMQDIVRLNNPCSY